MFQIISAILFYSMFFTIDALLWLIWRDSVRVQKAHDVLHVIAIKNADAAQKAADAAYILAKSLEKTAT